MTPAVALVAAWASSLSSTSTPWLVVRDFNAIPSGDHTSANGALACESGCRAADGCTIFAYNEHSKHCFRSTGKTFHGEPSDHVISGCNPDQVKDCVSLPNRTNVTLPGWSAAMPKPDLPMGGYPQFPAEFKAEIFHATRGTAASLGTYNHNCMLDYLHGSAAPLSAYWKNCQVDEDCDGQRILFSQSATGQLWTFPIVLFPNMTAGGLQATMEPGPFIHVNGRLYAGASPGVHNTTHDSSAQGSQFCLWPDPLNPRNCGPPSKVAVQYTSTLLMREILPVTADELERGIANPLGPLFWAAPTPPALFAAATAAHGIPALPGVDAHTQGDVAALVATQRAGGKPTCSPATDGTLKCEACEGGCQVYSSIDFNLDIANERTHWVLPNGSADVIAYRSEDHSLWATVRTPGDGGVYAQADWPKIARTTIPNDNSNLNAGPLPDGKGIFLVHNPVTPASGKSWGRDPVTISIAKDGLNFATVGVGLSCHNLSTLSGCMPRYEGHSKNPGPSYPQALTVVAPAPAELQGLYLISSNNKEDIWIAKFPFDAF